MTSELVTNAVRHGEPPVGLHVACAHDRVYISVSDSSPAEPRRTGRDHDALGGRGMDIVEALADAWGVRQHPGDGKDIWVTLPPA